MNLSEQIRQAREAKGLSQEALAERLDLSRQAVSKWEMGASTPTPENLEILGTVLEVDFSQSPPPPPERRRWLWAAAGAVCLLAGLLILLLVHSEPSDPAITSIRFFDEAGTRLYPNLGDGWNAFETPEQGSVPIIMVVSFQNGSKTGVNAVSLFYTPAGTETFGQRDQWRVQAVEDGLDYVLFVLDLRRHLMGELEVRLECGGMEIAECLNITTVLP